jgi:hypothetical protein
LITDADRKASPLAKLEEKNYQGKENAAERQEQRKGRDYLQSWWILDCLIEE